MAGSLLGIGVGYRLQSHSPIDTPRVTESVDGLRNLGSLDDVIERGRSEPEERLRVTEAYLFLRWKYQHEWRRYLDSPLTAHADAALALKESREYDAVVGVKDDGLPYADIFAIMGFPVYEIDFSHRRGMEEPQIDENQLKELRQKEKVLVVDINFLTGRTLNEVIEFLRGNGVGAEGVYLGLSRWHGIDEDDIYIGGKRVDFDILWQCTSSRLRIVRLLFKQVYRAFQRDITIFNSNPEIEERPEHSSASAIRVARGLKSLEQQRPNTSGES